MTSAKLREHWQAMNVAELLTAVEAAVAGEWKIAHGLVQPYDDAMACWIHAVLHKIEGDLGNSLYWYAKAGKTACESLPALDELAQIKAILVKTLN